MSSMPMRAPTKSARKMLLGLIAGCKIRKCIWQAERLLQGMKEGHMDHCLQGELRAKQKAMKAMAAELGMCHTQVQPQKTEHFPKPILLCCVQPASLTWPGS